jgi:cold-inducible RNA-binding protein
MKKLYVGNLSYNTNDQELTQIFSKYGTVVSAKVIMDRDTNSSKGFAFVEMSDEAGALSAIEKLDGSDLNGRNLKVNEARDNNSGGGSSRNSSSERRW